MADLRDHFRGALLGTFVGDALGMPLEGGRFRIGTGEVREMLEARLGRGTYTDDTQLMIALAEALLDRPGQVDLNCLATRFGENYDPRRGYGGNARHMLAALKRGVPWRQVVDAHLLPGGSFANGAAMRVAPVALACYPDHEAVARAAEEQAEITGHTHPEGRFGARMQALAVLRALEQGGRSESFDGASFIEAVLPPAPGRDFAARLEWIAENSSAEPRLAARFVGTGGRACHSVPMALWCFLSCEESAEEAIVRAVNVGGDSDTIGAMAGAIAGAYHGAQALPDRWTEVLENGAKGRDYVLELADRLYEAVS